MGWFDSSLDYIEQARQSAIDWTSQRMEDVANFASDEWQGMLVKWNAALSNLNMEVSTHDGLREIAEKLGPDEFAKWQDDENKIQAIKDSVNTIQDSLSNAVGFVKQTIGLSALQGVGAVQLVPIAVFSGALAAVTGLAYYLGNRNQDIQRKWDFFNAHPELTPEQIAAHEGSAGGTVSKSLMWIAVIGALFVFGPTIMKQIGHGK